ncbi:hypothetical protein AGMMS50276_06800 [Synergistales bacterium]|nr:hypothetical protein AGMMS50276_06800 [Synergistales bacterium]
MPRDILFLIDERHIEVTEMTALNKEYQKLAVVLNKIIKSEIPLESSSDLWNAKVRDGITLTGLLWGEDRDKLDRDLNILLSQVLDRINFIDNRIAEQYAIEQLKQHHAVALVVSPMYEKTEELTHNDLYLHYIGTEDALAKFHQAVPVYARYSEDEFKEHLPYAFPRLFFSEKLDIGKFDEKYPAIREKLTNALAYLNDRFYDALHEYGNQTDKIEQDFKARCRGVGGIGQEAAKTMQVYGRQREILAKGKSVVCEWHIKLRPHIDRVHFAYEEKYKNIAGGKIIVGIFVRHLDV